MPDADAPVFVCQDPACAYRSGSVDLAERHENRTGHDVWEVPDA